MVNISKAENDVQLLYELLNSSKGFYDKKRNISYIHPSFLDIYARSCKQNLSAVYCSCEMPCITMIY